MTLKKLFSIFLIFEVIKTMKSGEIVIFSFMASLLPGLNFPPDFSAEQVQRFILPLVYMDHLCYYIFCNERPECVAPLKCPAVLRRYSPFILHVRSIFSDKTLIKKAKGENPLAIKQIKKQTKPL